MTVSNENLEKISALMDGELESAQSTINYLLEDEQARDAWQSMHLARDVAHNSVERQASASFSSNIMAALDAEPTVLVPQPKQAVEESKAATVLSFFKPVAGLAIAATVAAVTIFSFDNLGSGQPQLIPPSVATLAPSLVPAPAVVPVAFTGTYDASDRTYWQGSDEGMQDELNRYLVDHTEHSNPGGYQSMVPYVRVTGDDSSQ